MVTDFGGRFMKHLKFDLIDTVLLQIHVIALNHV